MFAARALIPDQIYVFTFLFFVRRNLLHCGQLGYQVWNLFLTYRQGMVWNGMENGMEISVWNMEDARMEWKGRFQEWNGRQSSILP